MIETFDQFVVKVCGVTSRANALEVVEAGADAVGINFYPKSKRFVGDALAEVSAVLKGKVCRVGVFVNEAPGVVSGLVRDGLIDVAQLHGDEGPDYGRQLGVPFIKAVRAADVTELEGLDGFGTGIVLLDAAGTGTYGGTGALADWEVAAEAVRRFPHLRILLAGGLEPGNVGAAVAAVSPAGVDVAGGVERAPGVKDIPLVREFVARARGGR